MLLLEKLEQKRKCVILVMVVCIIVCIAYSLFVIPKKVTSESTLMLIEKQEISLDNYANKGNLELTKKMISNFEEMIKSESSMQLLNEKIKSNININKLKNEVEVKEISNSDAFKIIIHNQDATLSNQINKELINIFTEKIKLIYANTEVYVVDNSHIEEKTDVVSIVKVILIFISLGIIVNIAYLITLVEIDKRVKKSNDIESELALKILGRIPLNKSKNKLIDENSRTAFSLAFKNLRSNIQFINVNNKEKNTILITSSKKSEGKTLVAVNLAIAFAKTGKKVILIDADMNSGKIDKMFNIPNDVGLSNYLSGIDENGVEQNERINKFIKDTAIKNLNVITSGTIPPNSSELLSMPKFEEMLKDLSIFYNVVIIDGTRVLNATDALILTRLANSTIIVSNYRKTKKDDLWNAKRDIQNVGGRIIGLIINKVNIKEDSEKLYYKTKKLLKEKYLKLRDYIIAKADSKKQKLLDAAIIEEKQKVVEELKVEEKKLIEEIRKENLEEKKQDKKEEKTVVVVNQNIVEKDIAKEKVDQDNSTTKEKNISQNSTDSLEIKEEIKPEAQTPSEKINIKDEPLKLTVIKEKITVLCNSVKEKALVVASKTNEFIKKEISKVKEAKIKSEEKKIDKIKEQEAQEKIKESKELIKETSKKELEELTFEEEFEQENENNTLPNENSVLVIVDAENGYCRAFSKYCFTEKLIRGIDQTDGFVKANYSSTFMNRKRFALMTKYDLTKTQVDRIDTLIHTVLEEYDECVWAERKMTSNKAEDYLYCMTKEYERSEGESKANYNLRCQYLRKVELAKAQIEIEYKLDNMWTTNQINFTDKIVFYRFAQKFQNLKEKRKAEQRANGKKQNEKIKLKSPIDLLKKIKIDEVKVKSVEDLTKEVENTQNSNDYENYKFEDYEKYNSISEQELEEQRIKEEQENMLKEQQRIKQELKEQKVYEKKQRRKEKNKKRVEQRKNKELERQKAREEARIEEELLVDNLYPKTKYNKNL